LPEELYISFGHLDYGPNPQYLQYPLLPYGSNFSFRKEIISEIGEFDTSFGLGKKPITGEEIDFCYRISKAGYKIFYSPGSIVYHKVYKYRFNEKWLLHNQFGRGAASALFCNKHFKKEKWKIILFKLKDMGIHASLAIWFSFLNRKKHIKYKLSVYRIIGYLTTIFSTGANNSDAHL
ncbi:MAG: hypothetical protein JSV88_12575, partial [Candidatus Aminicenantes bacterium]